MSDLNDALKDLNLVYAIRAEDKLQTPTEASDGRPRGLIGLGDLVEDQPTATALQGRMVEFIKQDANRKVIDEYGSGPFGEFFNTVALRMTDGKGWLPKRDTHGGSQHTLIPTPSKLPMTPQAHRSAGDGKDNKAIGSQRTVPDWEEVLAREPLSPFTKTPASKRKATQDEIITPRKLAKTDNVRNKQTPKRGGAK